MKVIKFHKKRLVVQEIRTRH